MKLYFITSNKNKLEETRQLFLSIKDVDIKNIVVDLPEVQGLNPQEIIQEKIKYAKKDKKLKNKKIFVEDTSLFLKNINGFPGPLIKWYYLTHSPEKIYSIVKQNPKALAQTSIGYYDGKEIYIFTGKVYGKIVKPRGNTTFDWDVIFLPNKKNKTFAEMTKEEKNKISMRKKAILKFKKHLLKAKAIKNKSIIKLNGVDKI